jgi:hypothetical protein
MTPEEMKEFMNGQIEEMLKHKWIESEKAGYDLGEEANKDYLKNHASAYREGWNKNHPDSV